MNSWASLVLSPENRVGGPFAIALLRQVTAVLWTGGVICAFCAFLARTFTVLRWIWYNDVRLITRRKLQSVCLATACEPNKEQLRVHPETRSASPAVQMASSMAVDKPKQPKLDVDQYLSTAISSTPADLHPYFDSFQDLHSRKYVTIYPPLRYLSAH